MGSILLTDIFVISVTIAKWTSLPCSTLNYLRDFVMALFCATVINFKCLTSMWIFSINLCINLIAVLAKLKAWTIDMWLLLSQFSVIDILSVVVYLFFNNIPLNWKIISNLILLLKYFFYFDIQSWTVARIRR